MGPTGRIEAEVAIADQAAASLDGIGAGQAEGAVAHVQDMTVGVVQAGDVQDEVEVADLDTTEAVVQRPAAGGDAGIAGLAKGAQGAVAVVQAGGVEQQRVAGLDQTMAVVESTAQAEIDGLSGDLAALSSSRALVVEAARRDIEPLLGVEATTLVGEGVGHHLGVARQCGDMAGGVVHLAGGDFQRLGLGGAAAVVEQPGDIQPEPADQAGEHALGAVIQAGGGDLDVTALAAQPTAAIAQRATHLDGKRALALQGAGAVVEAARRHVQVALLAVDQAVGAVVQCALDPQVEIVVGGQGAAGTVVQAAGEQFE